MNRRVALFVPSMRAGGAERVMMSLSNEFVARGLSVDLVLVKATGPYLCDIDKRIRIVNLNSTRVLFSLPILVRYLVRERPGTILSAMTHTNVIALCASKLSLNSTRVIVSEHTTLTADSIASSPRRAALVRWLAKYFYRKADRIIAVSFGVADAVSASMKIPRNMISVIYNPVVTSKILDQSCLAVNHPWLAPGQPPVILAVGRLTPAKDFSTLIRAFVLLRLQRPAKLLILGEGELRKKLEEQVNRSGMSEYIAMPGFVENPFAYMRKASLFVLSSAWEGLPSTLIQAMACGVPVVSTNCHSGPIEILEGGKWGRLVPVGNAEALAKAISDTLDEKEFPDVFKRASDFGLQPAVDSYLKSFQL